MSTSPRDAALLNDIRNKQVVRRLGTAGHYDWNDAGGRDVTDRMKAFQQRNLITLMPRGHTVPSLWRLTKAGHAALAAGLESADRSAT